MLGQGVCPTTRGLTVAMVTQSTAVMDAIKRPLSIPPEFGVYAEEKGVFQLYEGMLSQLLLYKPPDPLAFLAEYLARPNQDTPQVVVYGPPTSGQHTMSKMLTRKIKAVHVQPQRLLQETDAECGVKGRAIEANGETIPPDIWAELVYTRLQSTDCVTKGWVLEGLPKTKEQALALKARGILPKHFIHLIAPDNVLVERFSGKRVDSLTGDVYHVQYCLPSSTEVAKRLTVEPGGLELMKKRLSEYHRHSPSLLNCYSNVSKSFNVDQPLGDIFEEVCDYLSTRPRSAAPHTPRVLLLGPTGSGKSLQALHLTRSYNIVSVDVRELIRRTLSTDSKMADKMRPYHDKGVLIPDDMVMEVLGQRLCKLDAASRGWVVHGFPLNRNQAELLNNSGHAPNRVFFLNIPEDSVKERLTLRRMDPITGERYHILFKPPRNQEVKDRLVTHPRDTENSVASRLALYNSALEDLMDCYTQGQHVNADQDPLTVMECIEAMLVNPLPQPISPTTLIQED